jgi:1,2-diacylglycerol 3-beta-galactosyltransferase
MTRVDLVYFNAGGGHRATALALRDAIAELALPWEVRLVDLVRVLDPSASFRRTLGFDPEQVYNLRLQRGWTLGLAQELKLLQGALRLAHRPLLTPLVRHWAATEPDLVVSLVPNVNRVLCESVATALPGVPYVTVLTDMADHPPHFWIEPGLDQWLVCGTPRAVQQAQDAGVPASRIAATSGMVIKPSFYRPPAGDRRALRASMGLDPDALTAVVMFGGQGSRQMLRVARLLDDVQLVLLCGRNERLREQLATLQRRAPHAALGFHDDIAPLMRLGDLFLGKPGPGCLSEAVHLGLPVVTLRNAWTLPQERYNTEWVEERGVGLVVPSLAALPAAVRRLGGGLERYRDATRRQPNRAVWEVPEVLAAVMAASEPRSRAGAPVPQSRAGTMTSGALSRA